MRRIKLSESQRDEIVRMIQEMANENLNPNNGITIKPTNQSETDKNNPVNSLTDVERKARGLGINTDNPSIKTAVTARIGGEEKELTATSTNKGVMESVVITKRQLDEARLKELKKNSEVIKVKNLVK